MLLVLKRTYQEEGTNGDLLVNGKHFCFTIELPWKENAPQISCIPEGRYALKRRFSNRHRMHLELVDVPGRSLILIHKANDAIGELRGCIAPVEKLTAPGMGYPSAPAFNRLMALVSNYLDEQEPVYLLVTSVS